VPPDRAARLRPQLPHGRPAAVLLIAVALVLVGDAFAIGHVRHSAPRGRLAVRTAEAAVTPSTAAPTVEGLPGPPPTPIDRSSPLRPIVPGAGAVVADPVTVSIPAIGVDAHIVGLVREASGVLEPPTDVSTVGWYAAGTAPGAVGPALLAGHVDSKSGPAVFWRLRDLRAGDVVTITGADRTTVSFTVSAVAQYPKDAFPTNEVYGVQAAPVLRLVTCGGTFNEAIGHYRDNIVVYASETAN
jgi:hypothetical protein